MDESTYDRCRQRGCIRYGLWHTTQDTGHRFRTVHTALAAVAIEKRAEDGPWSVWMTPHGGNPVGPLLAPPDPAPGVAHDEHMELRGAVLYALRTAEKFNAA
jgi:hypothetical protein